MAKRRSGPTMVQKAIAEAVEDAIVRRLSRSQKTSVVA
ncbi:hypothetical protein LuPra_03364 [Luteitalea pratensis]|uniref:Uncharacterized protein n=1 Tax=Luteitalea pratensis TaxID=1855912 RepID=A0A143PP31_LUTPR|nr:hypothetical protein LuPra_03364 [Luteitalea pratensis]